MRPCQVPRTPNQIDTECCNVPAVAALVRADSGAPDAVVGLLCGLHAGEGGSQERNWLIWRLPNYQPERLSMFFEVRSLWCAACKQALSLDGHRHPGPLCPECLRAQTIERAMAENTQAQVKVLSALSAILTPPVPALPVPVSPKESTAMTTEAKNPLHPVLQKLEVDATAAAWRMAGSQFVKLARDPVVALLSRHLGPDDESLRGRIAAFLDTELGASILAGVLSAGLSALPLPKNDVSQRLAGELRVRSMAGIGDSLADVLMGPLRQVAVTYLQGQPPAPEVPAQLDAASPHNAVAAESLTADGAPSAVSPWGAAK